ncbi:MAG TPA: amidohydrolase family protein [Longimicrobiales bacterium]|nr:amidohydrolase family protein [Longimicrobiales bacterium]
MNRRRRAVVRAFIAACVCALPGGAAAQAFADLAPGVRDFVVVPETLVALVGVRLVDGTGAPARDGVTVVVRDGRIAAVGPTGAVAVPDGARVVDGAGQTLMPGLVMLHEHLFYPSGAVRYNTNQNSFPPLYLAGGVTTMRTGGSMETYTDLRVAREIEAGRAVGPHMDVTGPYLEGEGGFAWGLPALTSPQEARDHVNFWADRGVTSFKAYNLIDGATLKAGIEAAHARGIKVTGHLCSITYREATEMGIDNLEHGFYASTDFVADKQPDQCPRGASESLRALDVRSPDFVSLVATMVQHGVALTSTLTVFERAAAHRPPPPPGAQAAMLPELREQVMQRYDARQKSATPESLEHLHKMMALEKAFYDAGGLLVVGTDPTGAGDVVPGYANQRALQLLVEMGLSAEKAVEVATRNGAVYLGRADEIGTVAVGKRADLVLVRGDPTADPEAFRQMTVVFKDGVGYDSAKLFESVRGWVGVR